MDKTIKWFEINWKNIGLVVALLAIGFLLLQPKSNVNQSDTKDVKVAQKKLADSLVKDAECSPAKVEQVIQLNTLPTLRDMLPNDAVVFRTSTMQIGDYNVQNDSKTKKQELRVRFQQFGTNQSYVTIEEFTDNLNKLKFIWDTDPLNKLSKYKVKAK